MLARRSRRYGGESGATVYLPKRAYRLQSEQSKVSGHARASIARIPAPGIRIDRPVISLKQCRAPNVHYQDANLPDESRVPQAGAMTRYRAPCAAHPRTLGTASNHDSTASRCAVACDRPSRQVQRGRSLRFPQRRCLDPRIVEKGAGMPCGTSNALIRTGDPASCGDPPHGRSGCRARKP